MFELFISDSFCCFGLRSAWPFTGVLSQTGREVTWKSGRSRETSSVSFARKRRISLRCERSASTLLTDTDCDHVRSLSLRYDCRARIRGIHNPGCSQPCLQMAPNLTGLVGKPGLYHSNIGNADYDDKCKHDRVFYRSWIVQEGHRNPGLGLSVG